MCFTKINNTIIDSLCQTTLSKNEMRVFMVIIRLTLGFHKKESEISLYYFSKKCNLEKRKVSKLIKNLQEKNYISKTKTGRNSVYSVVDPSLWDQEKPVENKKCEKSHFSKPTCFIYKINNKNKTTKEATRSFSLDFNSNQILKDYVQIKIKQGHPIQNPHSYTFAIRQAIVEKRTTIEDLQTVIENYKLDQKQRQEKKKRNEEIKKSFDNRNFEIIKQSDTLLIKIQSEGLYENLYKQAESELKNEIDLTFIRKIPKQIIEQRMKKLYTE